MDKKIYNISSYKRLDSLTTHGDHESKYGPELRKIEKLIAK